MRDKIGTPREERKVLIEGVGLKQVRDIARKIKPRMDRKVMVVADGRERPIEWFDREALDQWFEEREGHDE